MKKIMTVVMCYHFTGLIFMTSAAEGIPYRHSFLYVRSLEQKINHYLQRGYLVIHPIRSSFDTEKCMVLNGPPLMAEQAGCAYLKYLFDMANFRQAYLVIKLEGPELRVTSSNVSDLYDTLLLQGKFKGAFPASMLDVKGVKNGYALIYKPHQSILAMVEEQAVGVVTELIQRASHEAEGMIELNLSLRLDGQTEDIHLRNWIHVIKIKTMSN